MYEKYCDTFYLTQGNGRQLASITILANPVRVPAFDLKDYSVIRKNNEDFLVDNCGGYVKVEDLKQYNISYNC